MPIQSFNAICNEDAHTIILGSMPGVASLEAHQYYAHKRNGFWPIMLAIVQQSEADYAVHDTLTYDKRLAVLQKAGIGLWDVLATCERSGSLDAAIKANSVVMNDFHALLKQYPKIKTVAFNGKLSEKLFHRHVMPQLVEAKLNVDAIRWIGLPSSSPAMASLSLQQKHLQWADLLSTDSV